MPTLACTPGLVRRPLATAAAALIAVAISTVAPISRAAGGAGAPPPPASNDDTRTRGAGDLHGSRAYRNVIAGGDPCQVVDVGKTQVKAQGDCSFSPNHPDCKLYERRKNSQTAWKESSSNPADKDAAMEYSARCK
jgi:hypothetical protein